MCKYCNIPRGSEGELELEFHSNYRADTTVILSDWYDEGVKLEVDVECGGYQGFYVTVEIPVKYCPNCGRRLYGTNQQKEVGE